MKDIFPIARSHQQRSHRLSFVIPSQCRRHTKSLSSIYLMGLVGAFCLLLGLVGSSSSYALSIPIKSKKVKEIRIDAALTSVFERHVNSIPEIRPAHAPNYYDLRNKLDLSIGVKEYTLGGRFDTYNFFDDRAPCHSSFPDCKSDYRLEKIYLKVRKKRFELVAGDFYYTIGRGIALSIRKIGEFAIDNTLRGARASYNDGKFKATIGGGFVNTNNFDALHETLLTDTKDFIFAGTMSRRMAKKLHWEGHYVYVGFYPRLNPGGPFDSDYPNGYKSYTEISYAHIFGSSLKFSRLWNRFDAYFEGNGLHKKIGNSENNGYAFYNNINAYFFPFTVTMEAQWNKSFAIQPEWDSLYVPKKKVDPKGTKEILTPPMSYINPPTLDKQDLDHVGDTSTMRALRIRIDYTLPSRKMVLYLNYMLREGVAETEGLKPLLIHHIFAGGEYRGKKVDVTFSGGWRETLHNPDGRAFHGDVDSSFHMTKRFAIEVKVKYAWHKEKEFGSVVKYHILDTQLGLSYSKIASLAFLFSYSEENIQEGLDKLYFAVQAKVFLHKYGSIQFLAGAARGGLRCISGVCRDFPPFKGVRGELTLRF